MRYNFQDNLSYEEALIQFNLIRSELLIEDPELANTKTVAIFKELRNKFKASFPNKPIPPSVKEKTIAEKPQKKKGWIKQLIYWFSSEYFIKKELNKLQQETTHNFLKKKRGNNFSKNSHKVRTNPELEELCLMFQGQINLLKERVQELENEVEDMQESRQAVAA